MHYFKNLWLFHRPPQTLCNLCKDYIHIPISLTSTYSIEATEAFNKYMLIKNAGHL